jgi:putative salt-induced outer membrane protein YdiY
MVKNSSRQPRRAGALGLGLLVLLAAGPIAASGQNKPAGLLGPWAASAEISYVVAGGNTSSSALSLGTSLSRKWTNDTLLVKGFILTSNAKKTTRTAQGTVDDYAILEDTVTSKVAENYLFSGQYDRRISKKLLGQTGLSWDRNRFAGVDDRLTFTTGFGYGWIDRARAQIKTSAGLTFTVRQYVGQDTESFAGFRMSVEGTRKILEKSSLSTLFVFDENLKRMVDWRFDWTNAVTASVS